MHIALLLVLLTMVFVFYFLYLFFQLNKTEKILQDAMLEVEASMQANYGIKKPANPKKGKDEAATAVVKDLLKN